MFVSSNTRQKSCGDTHLNSCLSLVKCFLTTRKKKKVSYFMREIYALKEFSAILCFQTFSSNDRTCYFFFISHIKIYEVIEIFARVASQKARLYAN